uniref:Transglutaminase-like domain-containing protein n=1 Tax=Globisporangium ultimum (strain ATCC 200006 / CBS 805.95 / DAOM BR144) TaxID=431595 RepID=K3WIA4_GLOUD
PPSPAYIKVARDLNEGVPGKFAQPIYLYYTVAPLGGFVCDSSRNHSEFGECLFLSRHYKQLSTIADFDADRVKAATTLAHNRRSFDDKVLHSFYQQGQHSMMSRLQSTHRSVLRYESKDMQSEALKHIPVEVLHERARANPSPMPAYQDELVMQLLHWFKREFFSWMNQPKCSACGHSNTTIVRTEPPSTPEEVSGEAGRVEVYRCPSCGTLARFPRYNNPVKLLETRTGRCGEWANCFTLCCRAMGFEARYVLDFTDHVWTEVYSEHFNRWLHCDSCEDQLDCPLTYEVGWGKKLTYIFSFSHEEIVDTAKRYTQDWEEMQSRREEVSESWLKSSIAQLNQSILSGLPSSRAHILRARAIIEQEELDRGRSAKAGEVQGRVSGSAEWKNQRSEDGKSKAESGTTASAQTNSTGSTAAAQIRTAFTAARLLEI